MKLKTTTNQFRLDKPFENKVFGKILTVNYKSLWAVVFMTLVAFIWAS